jgi:acetyl esterase/lipase
VDALRSVSRSPVVYAELPGAHHAFDLVNNVRTARTAETIARFLSAVMGDPGSGHH